MMVFYLSLCFIMNFNLIFFFFFNIKTIPFVKVFREYILVVVWYLLLLISVRHREYIFEACMRYEY
ncbi:hypothetical protein AS587_21700 [Salmonella enterica subsp. enterica serovar Anatum]|nr:hypothetical protein AS587_21700 [Salmonella enterica subsp. enterica serovar Anatum]